MYRRSVLERLWRKHLALDQYMFEDNFFVAQASADGVLERIDDVVAVYRRTPNSATRSTAAKRLTFLESRSTFYFNLPKYFPERSRHPVYSEDMDVLLCKAAFSAGNGDAFSEAYARIRQHKLFGASDSRCCFRPHPSGVDA